MDSELSLYTTVTMPSTELLELEHAWAGAFQSQDRDCLESLLAAEFRLTFANDVRAPRAISREEWFVALGRMSFGSYEITDSEEVVFGNTGVLDMHVRFDEWRFDGDLLPAEYVVTDVFVRRDGRWQVVNRISESVGDAPNF